MPTRRDFLKSVAGTAAGGALLAAAPWRRAAGTQDMPVTTSAAGATGTSASSPWTCPDGDPQASLSGKGGP